MKIQEYIKKEKKRARSRTNKTITVCEYCGRIYMDKDKQCRHSTAWQDGSLGYYMLTTEYTITMRRK